MIWLDAAELPFYQAETPAESYERRMEWRREDVRCAHRAIARARAANTGRKRLGIVPVYAEDASEVLIDAAIRRLNMASWGTHG